MTFVFSYMGLLIPHKAKLVIFPIHLHWYLLWVEFFIFICIFLFFTVFSYTCWYYKLNLNSHDFRHFNWCSCCIMKEEGVNTRYVYLLVIFLPKPSNSLYLASVGLEISSSNLHRLHWLPFWVFTSGERDERDWC